jgi:hypothetical protein
MFAQATSRIQASRDVTTRSRNLLSLFIALVFTLTISPTKAHAQIIGDLEVSIPFQFHAGNAKLPPGKYLIHTLDNTDLKVMEIISEDGSTSALFDVRDAEANSRPAKSELIFNKYGNRYFLATKKGPVKWLGKARSTCLHTTRGNRETSGPLEE